MVSLTYLSPFKGFLLKGGNLSSCSSSNSSNKSPCLGDFPLKSKFSNFILTDDFLVAPSFSTLPLPEDFTSWETFSFLSVTSLSAPTRSLPRDTKFTYSSSVNSSSKPINILGSVMCAPCATNAPRFIRTSSLDTFITGM